MFFQAIKHIYHQFTCRLL